MKLSRLSLFIVVSLLTAASVLLPGKNLMAIEEPAFEVIKTEGKVELRRYSSFVIAETIVKEAATQNEASNTGFRRLFKYISGDNSSREKIEMTAPVIQADEKARGVKIDMTAPVQQKQTEAGWLVAFVLPDTFTIDTAPIPSDTTISLREIEPRTMAVLRFSGRWSEKNIRQHEEILLAQLASMDLRLVGEPEFAAYNAPFSLPFMRRNEVMLEVQPLDLQ